MCLLFHLSHNVLNCSQMKLKLRHAPRRRTPSASANRAPSVYQIRPVKSANDVPSEWRHFTLLWLQKRNSVNFTEQSLFGRSGRLFEKDGEKKHIYRYLWKCIYPIYKITGANQERRRWGSALPFLTQCVANGTRPLPNPPRPFLHRHLPTHPTQVTSPFHAKSTA